MTRAPRENSDSLTKVSCKYHSENRPFSWGANWYVWINFRMWRAIIVHWMTRSESKKIQPCARVGARAEGKGSNRTGWIFLLLPRVVHTIFFDTNIENWYVSQTSEQNVEIKRHLARKCGGPGGGSPLVYKKFNNLAITTITHTKINR